MRGCGKGGRWDVGEAGECSLPRRTGVNRRGMMALTANQVESLPPFVAAVLSECPEPLTRGADQPARQERRQHQRQSAVVSHRRPGPQGRCSAANKQRTLSDAQAIRQGTVAGTDGSGTPTPFWVEAGMRTAINRLCSVVLHAVGTGQLDLLHKCEASADQLQAHFRIPPWQSASSVRPLSILVHGIGLTDQLLRAQ